MQDELSESDVDRRRQAPVQDAPDASAVAPSPAPTGETAPLANAVGNQGIQQALTGSELGALAPTLAAEMMMAHAGMSPALLGSDSNSAMQVAMKAGGDEGQPGLDQALGALVGGGPVPEAAMNRIQTATGGTMGPLSGIPGTQPGMPRHYVDTAGAGIISPRMRNSDTRGQAGRNPGSVEHVFGAMAGMSEHQLDGALHQAGRDLLSGLGASDVQSLLGGDEAAQGAEASAPAPEVKPPAPEVKPPPAAEVKPPVAEVKPPPVAEVAPPVAEVAPPVVVAPAPVPQQGPQIAPPTNAGPRVGDPLTKDIAAIDQGLPKANADKTAPAAPTSISDKLKAVDKTIGKPVDALDKGLTAINKSAGHLDAGNPNRARIEKATDVGSALVGVAKIPGQIGQLTDGKLNMEDGKAVTGLAKTGIDTAKLLTGAGDATNLGRASKVAGAAGGLMNAPGQVAELANGKWDKKDAEAAVGLASTTLDTTEAAGKVADYVATKKAAQAAFKEAAPGASKGMLNAASKAAAESAIGGADRPASKQAIGKAMDKITGGSTVAKEMGATGRGAARTAQRTAAKAATTSAKAAAGTSKLAKAGAMAGKIAKGSGTLAGKAGARFVPGLNAAVAALDTKTAYDTLKDPKASTTSKVTSVITAAGSIAAATNIPVVSQVGAAVSTVSSLIGSIWG
ncbi:MAG: hypothetical protein H6735_10000 [Alphaproteobacteria bacterium]|nr:hypothetical protein [Alphaproteobacteria bacterium]